jgi:hypothetical protein
MNKARPEGFDYEKPDPVKDRCQYCNQDGVNRTGLQPIGWVRTSTTTAWAKRCEGGCNYGLKS